MYPRPGQPESENLSDLEDNSPTSSQLARNNSDNMNLSDDANFSNNSDSAPNDTAVPTTPRSQKSNLRTFQPQLVSTPRSSTLHAEVTKAGFLRKKGAKRRNWTKRYWYRCTVSRLAMF